MTRPSRLPLVRLALAPLGAVVVLTAATPAVAQMRAGGASFVPYTSNGYVGLNLGWPEYKLGCNPAFACDDPDASFHIYTGGSVNDWLGVEFGYLHMGKADRLGGTTRGHGLNLAVVGAVPLGQSFTAFGKLGTTWARTEVTASPAAGVATGDEDGFGLAYGAGVEYSLTSAWSLVAQWDRHRMKFAGNQRENVDSASIGARLKF